MTDAHDPSRPSKPERLPKPELAPKPERAAQPADDELVRARDLLARTVRFLEQCAKDPTAALQAEDPRALIRELQSLAQGPATELPTATPSETAEPRTIPLRRRRSA